MKNLLLSIFALFVFVSSIAQQSGVVIYEQTTKLDLDLPPEFKGMIPKERKSKMQLLFTANESIYKNLPEAEENITNEIESRQGNMHFKFKMDRPKSETYKNLKEGVTEVIEMPTKGKEITRKEFEKLRKEKMEEMKEMGGGRRIMIKH